MGQNKTPDFFRGFMIPYGITQENLWSAQSTYTQQGARAGVPSAKQTGTGLVLEARGEQGQDLDIKTVKGGTAGDGAGFVWKGSGESAYYGKDARNITTGFQFFKHSTTAAVNDFQHVDTISTSTGVNLTVYETHQTGGGRSVVVVRSERESTPTTVTLFPMTIFAGTLRSDGFPTICELNDGSILVVRCMYTDTDDLQIASYRSTDTGKTFTQVSTGGLSTRINVSTGSSGYVPQKVRMTSNNNSVLLLFEILKNSGSTRNAVAQYVSYNKGASFERVGISSSIEYHELDCVTMPDGSFGVAYLDGASRLRFDRIPYAGFGFFENTFTGNHVYISNTGSLVFCNDTGTHLEEGNVALFRDDDNVLYCIASKHSDRSMLMFASYDDGANWLRMSGGDDASISDATFYQPNSSGSEFQNISACSWEGRGFLIGKNGLNLPALFLGGYSTKNFPPLKNNPFFYDYIRFDSSWVPLELPATSSTYTTTGTGTQTISSSGLTITTSSTQRFYTHTPTISTLSDGLIVRFRVKMVSGGTTTRVRLRIDDGSSTHYEIAITLSTTNFVVVDSVSSTTKHTEVKTMTNDTEFIVALTSGKATVLHRNYDGLHAKVFSQIDITGLNNGGGGSGHVVEWGHLTSASGTNSSVWNEFHTAAGDSTGEQMIGTIDNQYIQYPIQGDFLYISGGLSLSTRESPAYENDEYEILTRYDYSINRVFEPVSSSPRVLWKSSLVTSGAVPQNRIAFHLDKKLKESVESKLPSDLVGIYLGNINFRTFKVKRYDVGSAAWVTMATVDTSAGLTSTFQRQGHSVLFSGVGADNFYLHNNECQNWRIVLGSGDSSAIRPIVSNSEGVWNGNTAKKAIVKLSDVDNTEPTSGVCQFMPNNVGIIISTNGETGSSWAIEIDSQTTHENDFEIGSLFFGHVAVVAPVYGRGRSITFEPNTQVFETLDGTTITRKLSDGRRVASVSWTDGVDTSSVHDSNPDPQYWQFSTTAGSEPVANYGDAPLMLSGLYSYLGGSNLPVVYVPSFKKSTSAGTDVVLLNRQNETLYGRTQGAVSIDSVLGNELEGSNKGELFRIASIQIREIE